MMMTLTFVEMILSRLADHPHELMNLDEESFMEILEELVITPFCDAFFPDTKAKELRPYYEELIYKDFRMFKHNPALLDLVQIVPYQDSVGRDFYFQSFYKMSLFLWVSLSVYLMEESREDDMESEDEEEEMDCEDYGCMDATEEIMVQGDSFLKGVLYFRYDFSSADILRAS